jgi:hypothetical protein
MKILIQDKVVETKSIADIIDVEANKKMFLNREAGFRIIFLDGSPEIVFKQNIPYESYPSQISAIKSKWQQMMDKVIEKWQSDKTEIEAIKLQ